MKLLYSKTTPKLPDLTLNKKVHVRGDRINNKLFGVCILEDLFFIRGKLFVCGKLESHPEWFISGPIQDWEAIEIS